MVFLVVEVTRSLCLSLRVRGDWCGLLQLESGYWVACCLGLFLLSGKGQQHPEGWMILGPDAVLSIWCDYGGSRILQHWQI